MAETLSLKQAAERVGVSPGTLRRWAQRGVIPEVDGTGEWTTGAVAHARIVARLRERGHKLEHIKQAGEQGRLAYGYIEELFGGDEPPRSLEEAAELTDLELSFEAIGQVKLKGFAEPRQLCRATRRGPREE